MGDNLAPGVNDDGSGTALTMELARVAAQSGLRFDATLVFICFAGEEQGLIGAKLHAQRAEAEKLTIDGVLNNDIVGNAASGQGVKDTGTVRVFSEGPEDSPSRQLARAIRRNASVYVPEHRVRLIARYDRFGRGGDHSAFNQRGYAGRALHGEQGELRASAHGGRHLRRRRGPRVPRPQRARERGDAGRAGPRSRRPGGGGRARAARRSAAIRPVTTRTSAGSASAGAAAYRIFWREAWTPDWQFERTVGNVTDLVMPSVSIDDFVFGVAAVDAEGHESLVSAYVNPNRPDAPVQTLP